MSLISCTFTHEDIDKPATRDEILAAFPEIKIEIDHPTTGNWLVAASWLDAAIGNGEDGGCLDVTRGNITLTTEWE